MNVQKNQIDMVELSNGCICCTLQDAFMKQIEKLASDRKIKRILVEASGISDPAAIASGFAMYQEMGLCANAYLDSIVCVVDADRIYSEFLDDLEDVEQLDESQDPDIINLVMDQIEFCNIILLNKCDLLSADKIAEVRKTIRTFQTKAEIIECIRGKINPDRIFHQERFDFEKVLQSSRIQEQFLCGKHGEIHDKHGIQSFLYEEKRPFDYDKFMHFLENDYPEEIIRAKGYVWFADDDVHVQLFEQAGRNASVTEVSNWLAAFSEEERQKELQDNVEVLHEWDEKYGDRLNQIVFIGKNMKKEELVEQLNRCIAEES